MPSISRMPPVSRAVSRSEAARGAEGLSQPLSAITFYCLLASSGGDVLPTNTK
jgi:hypothetical protein